MSKKKTPIKKTAQIKHRPSKMAVAIPAEKENLTYNKDFYKWTQSQVNVLRKGDLKKLDIENLIEEIESLGKNDKRALRSQITRLMMHLLKMKYQSKLQEDSNSWNRTIIDATREIKYLIEDSPSLENELIKIYHEAYEDAKQDASAETKLSIKTFDKECPWEIQEILPFLKKKKTHK